MGVAQGRGVALTPERVHVAGLPVVRADVARALELLRDDVAAGDAHVFAFVNAHSAMLRRDHPAYADLLHDTRVLPLPDGSAVEYGARLIGLGDVGRCPGPDFFEEAASSASVSGTAFFLLGGGPGVAEALRDALVANHPGLEVRGTATPPYGEWPAETTRALVEQVRESGAQVLWLGVSAPKQEMWALENLRELGIPVACVGAAFDFLTGTVPRAPKWVRRLGMEWAYRLMSEPRRLWRRYLVGNAVFIADLLRYRSNPATARDKEQS